MKKTITYDFEYQPLIAEPPPDVGDLYKRACGGDRVTIDSWKDTWIKHYQSAKDHFGSFEEHSAGRLHGVNRHKPAIVLGSGPSLKDSIPALLKNQEKEHPVMSISALHNFGYFEDEGIKPDYYLSLDSGAVVIDDVSESRNQDGKFYWEQTKGKVLLATIMSDPRLFELWQGELYLFNSLIPDMSLREEFAKIEKMTCYISSGGNAGGACMYAAKAIMGSSSIMYVGLDMCFDYDDKFHSYSTHYDNVGKYIRWPDVFGVPRKTWMSYLNFKFFLDNVAKTIPGTWINCSSGLLGSYVGGNLKHYEYMDLQTALAQYHMSEEVLLLQEKGTGEVVNQATIPLKDVFKDTKYEHDIVLF